MVLRDDGPASGYEEIDRWESGVGWLAHPGEVMERASHAVAVDGAVWVVDPLDAPRVDDLLTEFGDVAGVVVTTNRHGRDAAAIAERYDAEVYVPSFVDPGVDAPTTAFSGELAETGFRVLRVLDVPGWREAALFDGETLVVGDALGTAAYFTAPDERLGVHPMLRAFPPRAFRGLEPERVLVGHGAGVDADATSALADALASARGNAPRVWVEGLRALV